MSSGQGGRGPIREVDWVARPMPCPCRKAGQGRRDADQWGCDAGYGSHEAGQGKGAMPGGGCYTLARSPQLT
jgi:hypothetical protein